MRTTAAMLLAAGALGVAAGAAATASDTPWNGWESLRLKARKMLFFTGSVEMTQRREGDVWVLETATHARFFGATLARSFTVTRLDAHTGRPLELTSRSAKSGRHYRFDAAGYTVRKLSPVYGADAPIERWAVTSQVRHAYPEAAPGAAAPVVYDYYGMILEIGNAGLERPGDEARFLVATSSGVKGYRIRVGEQRASSRTFRDLRDGGKRSVTVRELRLRIIPEDPDDDEGFLKMEGETELWIESGSGTLLEISGKIPRVPGRVEIEIESIG